MRFFFGFFFLRQAQERARSGTRKAKELGIFFAFLSICFNWCWNARWLPLGNRLLPRGNHLRIYFFLKKNGPAKLNYVNRRCARHSASDSDWKGSARIFSDSKIPGRDCSQVLRLVKLLRPIFSRFCRLVKGSTFMDQTAKAQSILEPLKHPEQQKREEVDCWVERLGECNIWPVSRKICDIATAYIPYFLSAYLPFPSKISTPRTMLDPGSATTSNSQPISFGLRAILLCVALTIAWGRESWRLRKPGLPRMAPQTHSNIVWYGGGLVSSMFEASTKQILETSRVRQCFGTCVDTQ